MKSKRKKLGREIRFAINAVISEKKKKKHAKKIKKTSKLLAKKLLKKKTKAKKSKKSSAMKLKPVVWGVKAKASKAGVKKTE